MAAVSSSRTIESIPNEDMIENGSFGTVYSGTDMDLLCSFTVITKNPDFRCEVHSANVQKAKLAFLTEIKVRQTLKCTRTRMQETKVRSFVLCKGTFAAAPSNN